MQVHLYYSHMRNSQARPYGYLLWRLPYEYLPRRLPFTCQESMIQVRVRFFPGEIFQKKQQYLGYLVRSPMLFVLVATCHVRLYHHTDHFPFFSFFSGQRPLLYFFGRILVPSGAHLHNQTARGWSSGTYLFIFRHGNRLARARDPCECATRGDPRGAARDIPWCTT